MVGMNDNFSAVLQHLQSRDKLSDTAFAQKLGIDRSTWWRIKNGIMSPSMNTITKIMTAYPEIKNIIPFLLAGDNSIDLQGPCGPKWGVLNRLATTIIKGMRGILNRIIRAKNEVQNGNNL